MGGTQNVNQYDYVTTAGKVVLSIVESHPLNYDIFTVQLIYFTFKDHNQFIEHL